jgi:hypothetical protein
MPVLVVLLVQRMGHLNLIWMERQIWFHDRLIHYPFRLSDGCNAALLESRIFFHHLPHLVDLLRRPNVVETRLITDFFDLSTLLTLVDPQFINADTRALTQLLQFELGHERTMGSDVRSTVFVKCTYAERTICYVEVSNCN